MSIINYKEEVLGYLKKYKAEDIVFPKKGFDDQLAIRNITKEEITNNLISPKMFVFAEKQEREFQGRKETRHNCYFLFSKSKSHRYVIKFNDKLKVITAIPLGRKTLNKMSIRKILGGQK